VSVRRLPGRMPSRQVRSPHCTSAVASAAATAAISAGHAKAREVAGTVGHGGAVGTSLGIGS
jgi:hypothetical protein